MVFLIALAVIQWVTMFQCFRISVDLKSGAIPMKEGLLTGLGMAISAALLGAPAAIEIYKISAFLNGSGISAGGDYVPLWLLGFGSVLALIVFGYRINQQRKLNTAGFFAVGANLSCFIVGMYMAFVVVDQLSFYAPPSEDAGVLNWSYFKADAGVTDVKCDNDMLVVKGVESENATYRCPQQFVLIMGRFSGTPVVPWPSYTEGTSQELAAAVRTMYREASK